MEPSQYVANNYDSAVNVLHYSKYVGVHEIAKPWCVHSLRGSLLNLWYVVYHIVENLKTLVNRPREAFSKKL